MKLSVYLICPMLFFIFVSSAHINFNINNFVDVILDLRKWYSAATVIFAHPGDEYGDYGDLRITYFVHTCSRIFGRHHVVTLDIHFRRLERSLRYYHRIVQPLAIVILPDFNGYIEFKEATKTFSMSFPVWLVLFFFTPANGTHDHCHYPMGNPFNLTFDTQMLVMCPNDNILREWYSIRGKTTRVFDLAKWTTREGLLRLTNLSLYDRRNNMDGAVLRAVTIKDALISPKHNSNNHVASLYGKVLEELMHSLNFTLDIISEVNEYGIWNEQNQVWTGAMNEIVSGHADFIVADMSMTSLRIRYVDFTLPLIISKNSLFIREPGICGVKWLGYFQIFTLRTWTAFLTVIAVTPFLLCFMKISRGSKNIANLISDNFICIWGIFCQQALTEFPRCSSLRVAYFTIFCTAILVMAYYSAALVCFLTACIRIMPFRTIDEFVKDGTYKLIVIRGSADYDIISTLNKSFSIKLTKLMKQESELPTSLIDAFVQICNEKKLAYIVLNILKKSVERSIPCKLSSISTERIDNLALVLSKNNPYTGVINYHLQKFFDNGMIMRLKNAELVMNSAESKAYEPVHIVNIIPILTILWVGAILSIVILIIEKIHYLCKRQREKRRDPSRVFYHSKKHLFMTK